MFAVIVFSDTMVVNAPESPIQAEVIFVIEATSVNSAYINELKTNYIIPTLEYFHGGALEEGVGSGSVYGIVAYQAADCLPGLSVSSYGPFTSPETVVDTVDNIQFIGGHAESRACVTEALTVALSCLEELGRTDIPMHIILLCCSPPYSAYAGGLVPPGAPSTVEQVARQIAERGVQLSIAAAKRLPALLALYEHAGGELHSAQQRNYAKDPRHVVLLRGYSLKERPPSPAPPPAPDIQTDVYGQSQVRTAVAPPRPPGPQYRGGVTAGVSPAGGAGRAWLPPPPRQPYANSALLTQLAQPSYPPPPTQANIQRMQPLQPGPSAPPQRTYIWSGVLEWMEKGKTPGDQQKVTKHLPCQVSANSKDIEPELKVDTWPSKLLMQLMPKQLISNIGGQYLKDSKSVLFHLQQNEALDALTKVMVNGFAGCVHFSPMSSPPQCDIKVLILLYTSDKKAYLGFIPNNQATFVDRLRKVIQQQKMNKQLPVPASAAAMPAAAMTAAAMTGGGMGAGMSSSLGLGGAGLGGSGLGGSLASVTNMAAQQPQQHQQGMVMGGGMTGQVGQVGQVSQVGQVNQVGQVGQVNQVGQVGGKGPRGVPLDGLEAARQQNLEKIQHLQQTLEAAHQQEAQFKSQMDIMSHLHAAQQQEQHYKHLEEQQRKHQLQHQLQQQLRGAQRGLRPVMTTNPGLRHLLQQQPQYRAGGGRAPGPQQFDDVANYDFL